MRTLLLIGGLILLIAIEILRVYFIMPFPGSQYKETLSFAYWLSNNIIWLRILGLLMIAVPAIHLLRYAKTGKKVFLISVYFNAMFEDASTQSWWQQATGAAVAGPLKGSRLTEIPSMQMTLAT